MNQNIILSKEEKIVLNVIREYLNKNRSFNIEKILPFIHARFKMAKIDINNAGIEIALKSLASKNLVIEGSKLMKENVLNNLKRRKIYEFILKNPGIYLYKLINSLEMSNHIVVWHLRILIKL